MLSVSIRRPFHEWVAKEEPDERFAAEPTFWSP
jgi:hypothetical protein